MRARGTIIVASAIFVAVGTVRHVAAQWSNPSRTRPAVGVLSLPFIENRGQVDPEVAYYAPTASGTAAVTGRGDVLLILPCGDACSGRRPVVRETFAGARDGSVTGRRAARTRVHSYAGRDPSRQQAHLRTYDSVAIGERWPGVHVELVMRNGAVEKVFTLAPGADPAAIHVRIAGIDTLLPRGGGELAARVGGAQLRLTAPRAWQEHRGERRAVQVAYRVEANGYGFEMGAYDRSLPVVIDPLLAATYLGGCATDGVRAMVVNELPGHANSGDVYVAGATTSSDFEAPCSSITGDSFVAHYDGQLEELLDVVLLGSPAGNDDPIALTILPQGHPMAGSIVLLGETDDAAAFPGAGFGKGGFDDGFVAILAPDLTPQAVSYLGGAALDRPSALAVHPRSGEIYIAGESNSADFPGTAGGAQAVHGGVFDAFVARLSVAPDGTKPSDFALVLEQSTYLGGRTGSEVTAALAISEAEGVYLKGRTNSRDLPVTGQAPQPASGGGIEDLFVGLLSTDLTSFRLVSYLGGNGIEETRATRIVLAPGGGAVYLAGTTRSTDQMAGIPVSPGGFIARFSAGLDKVEQIAIAPVTGVLDLLGHPSGTLFLLGAVSTDSFPPALTADAAQPRPGGMSDVFAALYDAQLEPVRATYLGGSGTETFLTGGIHPLSGDLYVAGATTSTDLPFATEGAQGANAGASDGFVARLGADLRAVSVSQATYFGGSEGDSVQILALPGSDAVYVGGATASTDLPTTPGAPQPDPGGGDGDGFVARFTRDLRAGPILPPCVGDCDGRGSVTIDELLRGVNIALRLQPLEECKAFDANGDGSVGVGELIQAVNASLRGCDAADKAV